MKFLHNKSNVFWSECVFSFLSNVSQGLSFSFLFFVGQSQVVFKEKNDLVSRDWIGSFCLFLVECKYFPAVFETLRSFLWLVFQCVAF